MQTDSENSQPPLVEGGQGRCPNEVSSAAFAVGFSLLAAFLVVVVVCLA